MKPGFEILVDHRQMSRKGKRMLDAMRDAAPPNSCVSGSYAGKHKNLMLYGVGEPSRSRARQHHLRNGGNVIMWDLGYFDRESALRLAINDEHVNAEHLYKAPAEGRSPNIKLRHDADPDGPVLLVGIGKKSLAHLSLENLEWEFAAIKKIKQQYPGKKIRWRPKGQNAPLIAGTELWHTQPIEDALRGCSLVWCRHSNVGIDATIAGIPVHCEGGATLAFQQIHPQPTDEQRLDFLQRLGWFNWRPKEARQAWSWIQQLLSN